VAELKAGSTVTFTIYWTSADEWENTDFTITIDEMLP
jgi:hypothetical protein